MASSKASSKFDTTPNCEASQSSFFKRQLFVTPPALSTRDVNLRDKTAIVTGSNVGLGLECCRQLLGLGLNRLILAVRDEAKGEAARDQLANSSKSGDIQVWKLDMASYDSVTAFVERCKGLSRIDMVVLNAGVFKTALELNQTTGHDEVIQVNYLSTVLLTILLLPVVQSKNSPQKPGRIVLVSSETSAWAKFKEQKEAPLLPAFDQAKGFDMQERYYTSKLLGQLFLHRLGKEIPSSVAVVNAANPGLCYGSNLHHETHGGVPGYIFAGFKRIVGRSTPIGARTLTDAAANHGEETHGEYLGDCKLKPMAPLVYTPKGEQIGKTLWNETMAELSFANVQGIISELKKK